MLKSARHFSKYCVKALQMALFESEIKWNTFALFNSCIFLIKISHFRNVGQIWQHTIHYFQPTFYLHLNFFFGIYSDISNCNNLCFSLCNENSWYLFEVQSPTIVLFFHHRFSSFQCPRLCYPSILCYKSTWLDQREMKYLQH